MIKKKGVGITKEYSRLHKRAMREPGVAEVMRIHDRFQKAQALTMSYLRALSPITLQTNCTDSHLP